MWPCHVRVVVGSCHPQTMKLRIVISRTVQGPRGRITPLALLQSNPCYVPQSALQDLRFAWAGKSDEINIDIPGEARLGDGELHYY